MQKKIGQKNFFELLIKIDPLAQKHLSPKDIQRSLRAYEVKQYTKKSFFEFIKKTKSNFDQKVFKKIFINTPRELLHKKIEKRVNTMFKEGARKEVKKFTNISIDKNLSPNKIIGINEIKDYLNSRLTLSEAKDLIKQNTRQYANSQFTWSRGHMKTWDAIYSSDLNGLFKKAKNKIL